MGLDFDVRDFLANCRASKPPYTCPYNDCERTYRSLNGIESHVSCHLQEEDGGGQNRSGSYKGNPMFYDEESNSSSTCRMPRECLTYAEAQRMIEVEIEGRVHRININEPMDIVSLEKEDDEIDLMIIEKNGSQIFNEGDDCDNSTLTTKNGQGKRSTKKNGKHRRIATTKVETPPDAFPFAPVPIKLPEPNFRILANRDALKAPPRPISYFRYIDKSPEELDEQIEYDMDEEDFSWLELVNRKRSKDSLCSIPPDTFELLMDRLEKECYFLNEKNGQGDYYSTPAIDEDAVCCICNDGKY